MATIVYKLNTGGFTFLGFLLESEMLHLGGRRYIFGDVAKRNNEFAKVTQKNVQ
jgi:hypothetical protein